MVLILADNQDITRLGLRYLTATLPIYPEVKAAGNKKELVTLLTLHPEVVVVLDYTLFDTTIEHLLIFHERFPLVHWVLFSEHLSQDFIRRVLFSGKAFSILLKECTMTDIKIALEKAFTHERYICQQLTNYTTQKEPGNDKKLSPLTPTEKEILKLMATGKTTKEIASQRYSSTHTIMTHRKNIFRKLEINNIHEATKYALRAGIIDVTDYNI